MISARRDRITKRSDSIGKLLGFMPANNWTFLGLAFAFVSAYFLVNREFGAAAAFFAAAAVFDAVDGAVARYRRETSALGAYTDTISDRYSEGIVVIGLVAVSLPTFYFPSYFWAALYLFGSMMTTYAKAAAKEKSLVSSELRGGILERPERMIILFAGIALALLDPVYLTYSVVLLAVASNITALQRVSAATKSGKSLLPNKHWGI